MTERSEQCENCKWFKLLPMFEPEQSNEDIKKLAEKLVKAGNCKKNPPVPKELLNNGFMFVWPEVNHNDCCDEFRAKQDRCEDCKWFNPFSESDESNRGDYTEVTDGTCIKNSNPVTVLPEVTRNDFCGEFKKK